MVHSTRIIDSKKNNTKNIVPLHEIYTEFPIPQKTCIVDDADFTFFH